MTIETDPSLDEVDRQILAELQADGSWRAAGVVIPLAGRWQVRVDVLISDFELVRLQGEIGIRS